MGTVVESLEGKEEVLLVELPVEVVGDEDADNPSGFELPGADLSDLELDVVMAISRYSN